MSSLEDAKYMQANSGETSQDTDGTLAKKPVFREKVDEVVQGTANSLQIIYSMVNCTVGSGVLVLPNLFQRAGLICALIIEFLYGYVNYKTTKMYLQHLKPNEIDVQITVRRILGKKWWLAFNISSVASLVFQNMIYFFFANQMLYRVIEFILQNANVSPSKYQQDMSTVVFNAFSVQYLAFATLFILGPLIFIKDLSLIVRVNAYGVYALYAYFIFVIYVFIDNLVTNSQNISITWFELDVGDLIGAAAQGFSLQYIVGPIARQAAVPEKLVHNCGVSFIISGTIYILCGTLGLFGIAGKVPPGGIHASTLLDYYKASQVPVLIVAILFVYKLVTVFPLTVEPQRQRILEMIYGKADSPQKAKAGLIHNFLFLGLCFLPIYVPAFNINVLMTIGGAVCSFVFVYAVPIVMHIKCYHHDNDELKRLLSSQEFAKSSVDETQMKSVIYQQTIEDQSAVSGDQKLIESSVIDDQQLDRHRLVKCQAHSEEEIAKYTLRQRQWMYGVLMVLGIFTMVIGLVVVGLHLSNHDD